MAYSSAIHPLKKSLNLNSKLHHQSLAQLKQMKYPLALQSDFSRICTSGQRDIGIVGFSKLFDRSYPLSGKLLWLTVLVTMGGLCSWQLWISTNHFLASPTIKDVSIERSETVKFPVIYLCPSVLLETFQPFTILENCKGNCTIDSKFDTVAVKLLFTHMKQFNSVEPVWRVTHPPFFPGILNHSDVKLYEPCSSDEIKQCHEEGQELEDFTIMPIQAFWGGCLLLNTSFKMLYKGLFTSLTIVFHNRFYDEVMAMYKKYYNHLTDNNKHIHRRGLIIGYLDVFEPHRNHEMFIKSHEILQGFETNVEIRMKEFRKLNARGNQCKSSAEISDCNFKCITQTFQDLNLPCRLPFVELPLEICNMSDRFVDISRKYFNVYSNFKKTDCDCPDKCDEVLYSGTADVVDRIENSSQIHVKLFFPDNTYEITKDEYAYKFEAYLSDIGGNLGFFLGFSLLTAMETAEFFNSVVTSMYKNLLKK